MFLGDFPHGLAVKNLPCNAGGVGAIPGHGTKISHATEQISLCQAVARFSLFKKGFSNLEVQEWKEL